MDPGTSSSSLPVAQLVVLLVVLAIGLALGGVCGALWARARDARPAVPEAELTAARDRAADSAVVRESLDRLHDQLRDMAQHGVSWQSQLKQHVDDVRLSTDTLRRETLALSTALRRPEVRGRWGELHLRRVVELAGLVDRCDFAEQVTTRGEGPDGAATLRPDLVIQLAGGKHVVVDAKVPLDAFLDAGADRGADLGADVDGPGGPAGEERSRQLRRHARQLRAHVDVLAGKAYWRALPATPEFVVLFVPAESFLSAALQADPTLLEHAAEQRVVLATPTTLIALLRTVAYAWTEQTLAERTREIHDLGRDLHQRLGTMGAHLDRLGRSLTGAVTAYNRAVGSLETRVLVSARRFGDLGMGQDELAPPTSVVEAVRPLTDAALLDAVAEHRPELPDLDVDPDRGDPVRRVAT